MKKNPMFHGLLPILVATTSVMVNNATADAVANVGSRSWVWQNPLPQVRRPADSINLTTQASRNTVHLTILIRPANFT